MAFSPFIICVLFAIQGSPAGCLTLPERAISATPEVTNAMPAA
jgi:hypothetical protein